MAAIVRGRRVRVPREEIAVGGGLSPWTPHRSRLGGFPSEGRPSLGPTPTVPHQETQRRCLA
eukprot:15357532-Alexandrium_andersonii.AAC.1